MSPMRQVAPVYDVLFQGVEGDLEFYLKEAKDAGRVLYIACGTGRVLLPMLEGGIDVVGIDNSPHMLSRLRAKARRMGIRPELHRMDMRDFKLDEKFDLVIIPYRSFLHMKTKEDQMKALDNIHNHLRKGGRLILNFFNPDSRLLSMRGQRHVSLYRDHFTGKSYEVTEINSVDHTRQLVRTVYVVTERKDWVKTKRKMYLTVRYVFRKEFENLLRKAGFRKFRVYGGFHYQPFTEKSNEMVWIATRGK